MTIVEYKGDATLSYVPYICGTRRDAVPESRNGFLLEHELG